MITETHLEVSMGQRGGVVRHLALTNDRLQPSADVGRDEKYCRVAPGNRTVCVCHTIGHAVQYCLDPVTTSCSTQKETR